MSLTRRCTTGGAGSVTAPALPYLPTSLSVARTRVTFLSRQESNQRNAPPRSSPRHITTCRGTSDFTCLSGSVDGTSRQLLLRCSTFRHPCRSPVPPAARCVGHTSAASAWMRKSGLRLYSSSARPKGRKNKRRCTRTYDYRKSKTNTNSLGLRKRAI